MAHKTQPEAETRAVAEAVESGESVDGGICLLVEFWCWFVGWLDLAMLVCSIACLHVCLSVCMLAG